MKNPWGSPPRKSQKTTIPPTWKDAIERQGKELIQNHLIPEYVQPPGPDAKFNYIVDIYCKWRGNYFYFISKYACPEPNASSPSFENGFARMLFLDRDRFNLAFRRHTGDWEEVFLNLTQNECIEMIKSGGPFTP